MCRMRNWYVKLASRDVTFNRLHVESGVVGGSSVLRVNARLIPGLGKDGINNRDFTTGTKERPSVARGEIYTIAADFLK